MSSGLIWLAESLFGCEFSASYFWALCPSAISLFSKCFFNFSFMLLTIRWNEILSLSATMFPLWLAYLDFSNCSICDFFTEPLFRMLLNNCFWELTVLSLLFMPVTYYNSLSLFSIPFVHYYYNNYDYY